MSCSFCTNQTGFVSDLAFNSVTLSHKCITYVAIFFIFLIASQFTSLATEHRCGNQARIDKRSLPVPADTLVWPCWAQTTRKSLNCVCCFFHCLSGRNKQFWGCLHGLNFISLQAEQSKPWPDCPLVSHRTYTFRIETERKIVER